MKYLLKQVESKIVINKSEFVGILYPINTESDIDDALKDAKKRYPKATHYVTAWIRGENAEYASSNDDGEPARTAGYPILEVLMHHNITDILCVSVRYFGGIKLGAGGLVRAYRSSVVETLNFASFYEKKLAKKYEITFPYHLVDVIEHLLGDSVNFVNKTYLDKVTYEVVFVDKNIDLLDNIKHQISIKELSEEMLKIQV